MLVRDGAGRDPRAGDHQDATMRVDVIDAALRIVFGDEDSGILPDARGGEVGNDAAEPEVVVGDVGGAGGVAVGRARVGGVVVGQADDDEAGDGALGESSAEVADELVGAVLVWDAEVEGGEGAVAGLEDGLGHGRV